MGLILDTNILISSERRREDAVAMLRRVRDVHGDVESGISAVSAVELTHGIARAKDDATRVRREAYSNEVFRLLTVYPMTLEIAKLAGRIEGEEAARGNVLPFEDLMIGATAISLGFSVCTLNVKHFQKIPGLSVVTV
jgi:predicted nucleic acid-binding protein